MNALAQYSATRQAQEALDTRELVARHNDLLKRIAHHLMARLPASVQVEDLMQAGVVGLLEAARQYDPSQGAGFETYAGIRMRGAMLDELRRTDWTPRSVHRNARKLAEAVRAIEARERREASGNEIAAALGVSLDEYHRMLREATASKLSSVEEGLDAGEQFADAAHSPQDAASRGAFQEALTEAIQGLPERERLVMSLYYDEELNLREIGEVLAVSESRVCQIHGQALVRVRARMGAWLD